MTIYTEQDLIDLRNQKTRRFIALGIPCALLLAAVIYLIMVIFFTHLVGKLERRLRTSER